MPNLTPNATEALRLWLRERDWKFQRLADECNNLPGVDPDDWSAGGVRNAVNGHDPVRAGRINRIAQVTQANPTKTFPDGLTYETLIGADVPSQSLATPDDLAPSGNQADGPTGRATSNVSAGAA